MIVIIMEIIILVLIGICIFCAVMFMVQTDKDKKNRGWAFMNLMGWATAFSYALMYFFGK